MNGTELTRRDLIWREIDVALSSKCPLLHYLLNQKNGEENTRRVEAFVWRQATTTKKRKKMFQLNVMCLVSHVDRHTFARSAESRGCRAPLPHTNTRLLSGWINAAERQANARNKKVTAKNATEEMKQNESYCVMSCCAHDRFKRIAVIIVAPLPLSQFLVCVCVVHKLTLWLCMQTSSWWHSSSANQFKHFKVEMRKTRKNAPNQIHFALGQQSAVSGEHENRASRCSNGAKTVQNS